MRATTDLLRFDTECKSAAVANGTNGIRPCVGRGPANNFN
jgi:hypothetical protein